MESDWCFLKSSWFSSIYANIWFKYSANLSNFFSSIFAEIPLKKKLTISKICKAFIPAIFKVKFFVAVRFNFLLGRVILIFKIVIWQQKGMAGTGPGPRTLPRPWGRFLNLLSQPRWIRPLGPLGPLNNARKQLLAQAMPWKVSSSSRPWCSRLTSRPQTTFQTIRCNLPPIWCSRIATSWHKVHLQPGAVQMPLVPPLSQPHNQTQVGTSFP